MVIEIIHANKSDTFPKIGELYKAERYRFDPDKVTLLYKLDPETQEKSKDQYWKNEPVCNEYLCNCKVLNNG